MKQFKTSLRTLYKFRLYSIVNILGLAVSLACVIIIARYVHQETTVNHFAADLDRTYIMSIETETGQPRYGGAENRNNDSRFRSPLDDVSVERFTSFTPFEEDYIIYNDVQYKTKSIATDSNFLEILPYPILHGNNLTNAPDEAVLTRLFAQKLFGKDNPVGKTITFSTGDILKVAGVIDKPSSKSFLEFDILVNQNMQLRGWSRMGHNLVMLNLNNDVDRVNKANSEFLDLRGWFTPIRYQLVPLKEFYFGKSRIIYQQNINPIFIQGNYDSIRVLLIVALLTLFVGIFNFINIYSVINMKRERELGIKKIYGASLSQIASQFLFENIIMVLMAIFCAWFIIEVSGNLLAEKLLFVVNPNIQFDLWLSLSVIVVLSIAVSVSPFVRYTRSSPITSLRSVNVAGISVLSRKVFLLMQYIISFGILIIALFFIKQLRYMLNSDPGYKTENVIVANMKVENHIYTMSIEEFEELHKRINRDKELVERKIDESPLFTEWIFGKGIYDIGVGSKFKRSDKEEYYDVAVEWLSPEYYDMFSFQLVEGRLWDSTDVFTQYKCIINESAKKIFDISDINSTKIQPEIRMWYSVHEDTDSNPPYEIVGVIKDFNVGHLSKKTPPLILSFTENTKGKEISAASMDIMARFVPEKEKEAATYLKNIYKEINNSDDFTYTLLNDDIASLYEEDRRISNVYILFALLAVLISSMGLFALSLFDIQQRYREIALRKINGATAKDIMQLLLKKYLYLLVGAFVVAVPVSYFVISKYLEGFAHKAPISWWLFAVAAVVVSAISLLTLVWQIKRAMKINPANALLSE